MCKREQRLRETDAMLCACGWGLYFRHHKENMKCTLSLRDRKCIAREHDHSGCVLHASDKYFKMSLQI